MVLLSSASSGLRLLRWAMVQFLNHLQHLLAAFFIDEGAA